MSAVREAIAKAGAEAREKMALLDQETVDRLLALYSDAARELETALAPYLDATGTLRLEVIREYLAQTRGILAALIDRQRELLAEALVSAAYLSAGVFAQTPAIRSLLAEAAVRFVERFIAADGLKLSDQIGRASCRERV